jgi:RimJ/RimL family protein N-acetyltransferase
MSLSLDTPRLTLLACDPAHLLALIDDPARFEEVAGLHAAEGLRGFFVSDEVSPEWLAALRGSKGPDPWRHGFFVVRRETGAAIGSAGFTGPPDTEGVVEIAYGIVPSFEGRGYATEVAAALVRFAASGGEVRVIRAHTLPTANPSTRVLVKCGFRHVGTIVDPVDGPVWRWERDPDLAGP